VKIIECEQAEGTFTLYSCTRENEETGEECKDYIELIGFKDRVILDTYIYEDAKERKSYIIDVMKLANLIKEHGSKLKDFDRDALP